MFCIFKLSHSCRIRVNEWGEIFAGDPVIASTLLDRLLHHSHVINIRGESYRLKEKREAGLFSHSLPLTTGGDSAE